MEALIIKQRVTFSDILNFFDKLTKKADDSERDLFSLFYKIKRLYHAEKRDNDDFETDSRFVKHVNAFIESMNCEYAICSGKSPRNELVGYATVGAKDLAIDMFEYLADGELTSGERSAFVIGLRNLVVKVK